MSDDKLSYNELQERLAKAEAALESLRRGEVDLVIGTTEPLVVRLGPWPRRTSALSGSGKRPSTALKMRSGFSMPSSACCAPTGRRSGFFNDRLGK